MTASPTVSQKLKEWALAAEVVSGIAIIVTLIVLITEVRTNTDVARVAAWGGYIVHCVPSSTKFQMIFENKSSFV